MRNLRLHETFLFGFCYRRLKIIFFQFPCTARLLQRRNPFPCLWVVSISRLVFWGRLGSIFERVSMQQIMYYLGIIQIINELLKSVVKFPSHEPRVSSSYEYCIYVVSHVVSHETDESIYDCDRAWKYCDRAIESLGKGLSCMRVQN